MGMINNSKNIVTSLGGISMTLGTSQVKLNHKYLQIFNTQLNFWAEHVFFL